MGETKFTVILDAAERRMLEELGAADGRSSAGWLRMIIKREHAKAFPSDVKPAKKKRG